MKKWIAENAPWLVFLAMAWAGGLVAHIKAYEKAGIVWSIAQHVKSVCILSAYAGFAGLMIYLLYQAAKEGGYNVSEPLAFVASGIGGMFGAQVCDFLFVTGIDFFRKRLGLEPRGEPPKP